LLGVKV
jgi:hypothetical protein